MQLKVASRYPNIRGVYVETDQFEGRPAYVKRDASETWLFFSARFGSSPCWYFAKDLPKAGALESFVRSSDAAESPQLADWPRDVTFLGEAEQNAQAQPEVACVECKALQELSNELRCARCHPETADVVTALSLLRPLVGASDLNLLAKGCQVDESIRQSLEKVLQASNLGLSEPVFLRQPPACVEIGAGTASLTCLAVSLQGTVRYQWYKDSVPLHRAERPRLVVSGTPADEGQYTCTATAGLAAVSSSACVLQLSAAAHASRREEAARRARVESPMRRAAGAVQLGQLPRAVMLLSEAIQAATDNEASRAEALCLRAELHVQLGQWQDAFADASDALALIPSLARAHAARGEAAEQLGFLAEAASSWETAELLGGIPQAAARAEACRQKLHHFFAEQSAKWQGPEGTSRASDPEESWRRQGWNGRNAGAYYAGSFPGAGAQAQAPQPSLSPTLQQHLQVLELPTSSLPTSDALRSAYRRLALQQHPDKGGSTSAFQALQNAYEALLKAL
ncbi:unnamed protein product [Symbiodinium natans]|uniref:Uncharacterized protein n=1 Tax=Symbiodinium natans TaxID=878477 RepID=A0A812TL28_9DINO|nr:unnamed protein product [Symbiodinium natans]